MFFQLEVGHELAVYDASSGHDANRVKAISREQTDGLYVPITLSGTLVVDGAMVSAYASPSVTFSFSFPREFTTKLDVFFKI